MKIHIHNGHGVSECGRRGLAASRYAAPGRPATCQTCIYNAVRRAPTGGQS